MVGQLSIAHDVVCEVLRIVGWALHSVVRSRPRADSWRQRDLGQYAQYPRGRSRGQQKRSDPSARWHFGLVLVRLAPPSVGLCRTALFLSGAAKSGRYRRVQLQMAAEKADPAWSLIGIPRGFPPVVR